MHQNFHTFFCVAKHGSQKSSPRRINQQIQFFWPPLCSSTALFIKARSFLRQTKAAHAIPVGNQINKSPITFQFGSDSVSRKVISTSYTVLRVNAKHPPKIPRDNIQRHGPISLTPFQISKFCPLESEFFIFIAITLSIIHRTRVMSS